MNNDSPIKALLVVTATALVCSILVTVAAVTLQPIQKAYQNLERNRAIVVISGLTHNVKQLSDREIVNLFQAIEAKIVDLDLGRFDTNYNPDTFDTWQSANIPELSIAIPIEQDLAKLGRRSRLITLYLVNESDKLKRIILPIHGQGMWSKIYGFIALEPDLNTIADITFYQQKETAGIGDKILSPDWQASWKGRKIYDENHIMQLGSGSIKTAQTSVHQIDTITGATVTVDSVKNLVRYWFGTHGYARFLNAYLKKVNL